MTRFGFTSDLGLMQNGTARRVLTRASSSWDEAERASGGVLGAAGNKEGAVHRQVGGTAILGSMHACDA